MRAPILTEGISRVKENGIGVNSPSHGALGKGDCRRFDAWNVDTGPDRARGRMQLAGDGGGCHIFFALVGLTLSHSTTIGARMNIEE